MGIADLQCDLLFEGREPFLGLILGEIRAREICLARPVGDWNLNCDGSAVVWKIAAEEGLQIILLACVDTWKKTSVWQKRPVLACQRVGSVRQIEAGTGKQLVTKILDVDFLVLQVFL